MKVYGNMEIYEIFNILKSSIGYNQKSTPSGWLSFNAPCCNHVNPIHRPDKLKRGGLKISNGNLVYHCFNCDYSTSVSPDRKLSFKFKNLMRWMNIDEDTIKKLEYDLWKNRKDTPYHIKDKIINHTMRFEERDLPDNSINLLDAINNNLDKDVIDKMKYIQSRGDYFLDNISKFYSTTSKKDTMNRRIIIPFYWEDNLVGYVGRSIDNNRFKYFGDIPPNYIFNTETIKKDHEYIIITEGPFDALAVNGVALLGDKISKLQIEWLKSTNKKIIVVPDFEEKESKLEKVGLEQGWIIAKPEWKEGIKDCADALKEYGRLYTIYSIFRITRK